MSTEVQVVGAASEPASRAWTWWVGLAAGVLLGGVLLYSALGKALDPVGTGQLFAHKGLLPASLATAIIVCAVLLEASLGAALITGLRRPIVLFGATVLMAAFFALTTYEYFFPSKDASSCGCFGNLIARTPGQAWSGTACSCCWRSSRGWGDPGIRSAAAVGWRRRWAPWPGSRSPSRPRTCPWTTGPHS